MKQNDFIPLIRRSQLPAGRAALCCLALLAAASCSKDAPCALPPGSYPMTFAVTVDGLTLTRATADNTFWTGSEEVAVQVEGSGVKQYSPVIDAASVMLQAAAGDTPFYWQTSGETKQVSAWYCGTGYNTTLPTTWAVQSNQSSAEGYRRSEFLYAATNLTFADRNDIPLTFYHQTARVVINIKNAEAATDAAQIQSVVIGNNNNLALSGTCTALKTNSIAGTWNITDSDIKGTITSKSLVTAAQGCLSSYAALVIPQNMTGKKFIAVTLSNNITYYYTPTNDADAELKAGRQHTYNITVKHGYLDVVTVTTSGEWGGGDTQEVNSNFAVCVTDGGYVSSDNAPHTRAAENGYQTTFTAGDRIGVFAVKEGVIVNGVNNLCFIAKSDNRGGLVWQKEDTDELKLPADATYYAYYPYNDGLTGKPTHDAANADDFFANVINGWTPASDQSTFAAYTGQDLMVAKGTLNGKSLAFSMRHKMALVVIELPRTKYKFTNTPPMPDHIADAPDTKFDFNPCRMNNGTYRYLVKPGAGSNLSGSYTDGGTRTWSFSPSSVSAGNYKIFKVDGATVAEKEHTLAVGDFYMKDGSLLAGNTATLTAEQQAACIGIVFWVGDATKQDPTLKNDHPDCTHGLVVALKDDDLPGGMKWGGDFSVQDWLDSNRVSQFLSVLGGSGAGAPINNIQGYNNTKAFEAFNENNGRYGVFSVMWVVTYRNEVPAPGNSSGWYLPSLKELALLCGKEVDNIQNNLSVGTDTRDLLNDANGPFSKLGSSYATAIQSLYWSSTEHSKVRAYRVNFKDGGIRILSKASFLRLRSVLAF